ncbi:MAG: hypothetical protein KC731_20635, partial [Myxococcales bacterium]|nr:hypothetical protein [Myxococcales bacterium]
GTPRRDDRGVVVTFRDLFDNGGLSAEGKKRLAAVAEVAKRHQAFPVMVVLHADARAERAEAVRTALADQLGAERVATPVMAGDALPMVNPQGKHASRNSRVEIIFVSPRAL